MEGKIQHGTPSTDMVYIASLRNKYGYQICSGVAISVFHVLTAAYCIRGYEKVPSFDNMTVWIECNIHFIRDMKSHSKYNFTEDYDIGVIKVSDSYK